MERYVSILIIVMSLCIAQVSAAADEPVSRIRDVRIEGRVTDMRIMDLNADDRSDIVMLLLMKNGTTVFKALLGQDDGFDARKQASLELGVALIGVDIADINGDNRYELVRWSDVGIDVLAIPFDKKPVMDIELLMPSESTMKRITRWSGSSETRFMTLFRDFGGKTGKLYILPKVDGYDLWKPKGVTAQFLKHLAFPAKHRMRITSNGDIAGTAITTLLPSAWFVDVDNDGDRDIISIDDDRIITFTNDDGFDVKPGSIVIFGDSSALGDQQQQVTQHFCLPINKDQFPDIVRSRAVYGTSQQLVESYREIYLNRGNGKFETHPDLLQASDMFEQVQGFSDFTGDGFPDMVVSVLQTRQQMKPESDLRGVIPFLVTVRVLETEGYSKAPDFIVQGLVPVGLFSLPTITILSDADLNGDGKRDLVVPNGTECLVYWNNEKKLFDEKNASQLPLVPSRLMRSADFNKDGRSDLVSIYHPEAWGSVIQVFMAGFER